MNHAVKHALCGCGTARHRALCGQLGNICSSSLPTPTPGGGRAYGQGKMMKCGVNPFFPPFERSFGPNYCLTLGLCGSQHSREERLIPAGRLESHIKSDHYEDRQTAWPGPLNLELLRAVTRIRSAPWTTFSRSPAISKAMGAIRGWGGGPLRGSARGYIHINLGLLEGTQHCTSLHRSVSKSLHSTNLCI